MESNICYFCERPNGKRRRTDISGDAGCGLLRRQKEGMRQQKMQKKNTRSESTEKKTVS